MLFIAAADPDLKLLGSKNFWLVPNTQKTEVNDCQIVKMKALIR